MKDTYFLYGVTILAILAISAVFISYATDTLPMSTPRQRASVAPPVQTGAKKPCGCCAEKTRQILKSLRQIREKSQEHQQQYKQAMRLFARYGTEEGLRRIKKETPEVAVFFERFIEKNAASPEKEN
ncbi:hypothetical protein F4054_00700 [Candidatus Poribacteria bacterium]|nr:hypothetical protein [Candidatus Poribacteria bacterium]MYK20760.1 hypothetical protein [Candidatus Poribacteria bacterium]